MPKKKAEGLDLTPKQYDMIYKHEDVDEIFYGGAAGGAKSEGLLRFALRRRQECPGSVGLMLRKTFPELEKSLIRKSRKFYHHFAKWKEGKKLWEFPNGSIQEFGYVEKEIDVEQYQSAEYDDICFDELGHFNKYPYIYLASRLRPRQPPKGLRDQKGKLVLPWKGLMRAAGNPGGIGHNWIREHFVQNGRNRVNKVYDDEEHTYKTRLFIPAALDDNTLMTRKERAEYRGWLNKLPDNERRMLRDGDWEFNPGAAFPELARTTHGYDPKKYPVPDWATIVTSYDFGHAKPFSIGWWWIDRDGRAFRFAEWYGWNGKADVGIRMAMPDVAQGIHERETALGISGRVVQRPADPSIFAKKPDYKGGGQGPGPGEMLSESGIYMTPSDNNRFLGKQQLHERLRVPEDGSMPMMMISNDCEQFWRTVPSIPIDDKKPEDTDTDAEDHTYDEVRYFCMSRPITPETVKPLKSKMDKIMGRIHEPAHDIDEFVETFRLEEDVNVGNNDGMH